MQQGAPQGEPVETLASLIESLVSPGLNSLVGIQIQRLLISQQLQQLFDEFQINLADLQAHGLLTKLAGVVAHQVGRDRTMSGCGMQYGM